MQSIIFHVAHAWRRSLQGPMPVFLADIRDVLNDRKTFWLHCSVLVYVALLPFNTYGFTLYLIGYFIKYTEIALLFVLLFAVHAYLKRRLLIKKAWWLYTFLFLQAVAQFVSLIDTPEPLQHMAVAIAVARYSLLVFLLINVIRTEALLRSILSVMGIVASLITFFIFLSYLIRGDAFYPGQAAYLGQQTVHYLAYAILMYGAGLIYIFLQKENGIITRLLILTSVIFWLQLMVMHASKIGQVATLLFLIIVTLLVMVRERRIRAVVPLLLLGMLFLIHFRNAPLSFGDDAANKTQRRWSYNAVDGSIKIRQRGIAVGWLMGWSHPLTGIGAGQTPYFFDEYSDKVRMEATNPSRSFFRKIFFITDEVRASRADRGIFNIFMNAWAETGAPGLITLIGILGIIFVRGIRALWRIKNRPGLHPIHVLFPLFCAVLLMHQMLYLWVHPWLWTILSFTYAAAEVAMHGDDTFLPV